MIDEKFICMFYFQHVNIWENESDILSQHLDNQLNPCLYIYFVIVIERPIAKISFYVIRASKMTAITEHC